MDDVGVDLDVGLSPENAADTIGEALRASGVSVRLVDRQVRELNGRVCIVEVFTRYFFRTQSLISLTIVLDDLGGKTHVRATASGGNGWLWDLSARQHFVSILEKALMLY